MAIDVKKFQLEARRVTEFSITWVKNHPIIPATIALLFPLYIFLPSLFVFLVFVVPIFIFIAVAFRLIFHIHQQNLRNAKGTHETSSRKLTTSRSDRNLDKRGYSYAHAQSVRRRNSKKHELRVHFEDDTDGKDVLFPSINETPLVDKGTLVEERTKDKGTLDGKDLLLPSVNETPLVDKGTLVEERTKEIREVEVEPKAGKSKPEVGDGSGLRANKFSNEKLIEGGNSEDEEEAPERNKAVEWTEDDQKNLMDLGFSEMERNKRLESLIAKRKARKLLSMQVRRTLMNIGKTEPSNEIASILIPKVGAFSRTKSGESILSPTPGSAPSVLLPMHNPFDLPYDPQEEKPNLLGGFQEELLDNHRSDPVFRRHETFNLGAFSPRPWESDPSPSESNQRPDFDIMPKIREIPQFSRFKNQSGKEDLDEMTQLETSQENKTIASTSSSHDPSQQSEAPEKALDLNTNKVVNFKKDDDINLKDVHCGNGTNKAEGSSKLDADDILESISSSSSEINAPFSNANRDEVLRSLSFSVRKNIPKPELDTNIPKDAFLYPENPSPYEKKVGIDPFFESIHSRSQSIASDLVVEVSEVGSQITNLSSDGESPKYDIYVEEEGNLGNKEISGSASQLKRVEENEARSGQVPEVSEQDIIEVGFKKINQDIEEQISLESSQSLSSDKIKKVHEEVKLPNSTCIPKILLKDELALHQNNVENPEDSSNSVEKFLADKRIVYDNLALRQKSVEKAEDSSSPIEKFLADKQIVYELNDRVSLVHDEQGIIDFIQDTYGQDVETMNQGTLQDFSASTSKDKGKSLTIVEGNSKKSENDKSNSVKSLGGELKLQPEPEHLAKGSELAEKGPGEASSSASTRSMTKDKDPYIPLEKNKLDIESNNSVSVPEIKNSSNETQSLVSNNRVGTSEINPTLARPSEPAVFLGIDPTPIAVLPEVPVEQVAAPSSTSSSPNSVLQHKFSVDLATSMSFDEIHLASLISNAAVEQSGISQDNSAANVIRASDSVGLQESSIPLSHSTEVNMNLNVNDGATNKRTEDKLVHTSTDIGLLTPPKENEKIDGVKGVDTTKELQTPKELEGPSKFVNTIDNLPKDSTADKALAGNSVGLQKTLNPLSSSMGEKTNNAINDGATYKSEIVQKSADVSSLTSMGENKKIETIKRVGANEESQRSKEIEVRSSIDKTIDNAIREVVRGVLVKKSDNQGDIGLLTPTKEKEKVEVEGHSKLHNKVDDSKSVGIIVSSPGKLAVSEVNNDPKSRVACSHATEENTNSSLNDKATKKDIGDKLGQVGADIGSLIPTKENEKLETKNGGEAIEESQGPKEIEGHSKPDNKNSSVNDKATNKGIGDKLGQVGADIGSLTPTKENDKLETKKGGEAIDESQRPKEIEGHSKPDNTNSNVNDKATNKGTGDKLVQEGAEIGSLTPTKENDKIETKKRGEAIEESQRPREIECHSKADNTNSSVNDKATNKGTVDKLVQVGADIGSLTPTKENDKLETKKGGEAIEESQRPKEIEGHSKADNTNSSVNDKATNKGTGDKLAQVGADIGSLTPTKENDKLETEKGGEAIEESQRPKEIEGHSKADNTNSSVNDKATNKGTGDKLAQLGADIGSLTPTKENEKLETEKGGEAIEESQRPKEIEGHSKADNTNSSVNDKATNKGTGDKLAQVGADIGSLTPTKENEKLETEKGGEAIEESQRPKEIEGHSKADNTNSSVTDKATNKGTGDKLAQLGADIASLTPKKESEKLETKNGSETIEESQRPKEIEGYSKPDNTNSNVNDKATNKGTGDELVQAGADIGSKESAKLEPKKEESQRPKEIEGHFKPDNAIGNSNSVGVAKSDSGNLAASEVKSNPESRVVPDESEKK